MSRPLLGAVVPAIWAGELKVVAGLVALDAVRKAGTAPRTDVAGATSVAEGEARAAEGDAAWRDTAVGAPPVLRLVARLRVGPSG